MAVWRGKPYFSLLEIIRLTTLFQVYQAEEEDPPLSTEGVPLRPSSPTGRLVGYVELKKSLFLNFVLTFDTPTSGGVLGLPLAPDQAAQDRHVD